MNATHLAPSAELGRGRSGVVYLVPATDPAGTELAVKVFSGEALAHLVMLVLTGARNPYAWCEDAIRCAVLRRQVLSDLVTVWFDGTLRVADAMGAQWNVEHGAWEMHTVFVKGRPANLHHPFSADRDQQLSELQDQVMRPLQTHLLEAGLEGLVWQAGKGNPVAANNFLRHPDGHWTWIDLESGVPALFALDPLAQVTFYLPATLARGRPLFDDVHVPRLRAWMQAHDGLLERRLGADGLARLTSRVLALDRHQQAWHALSRADRAISCEERRGRISSEDATWYRNHVPSWYARELAHLPRHGVGLARRAVAKAGRWLATLDPRRALVGSWRALTSQRYRRELAQRYVDARIARWSDRGHLRPEEAEHLSELAAGDEAGVYLTDFGVHLALKPIVKGLQWWVIAPGIAAGLVDPWLGGGLIVFGGMIGRTAYTTWRIFESLARRRSAPWVAWLTGLLPVVGNAAFPVQVIASGASRDAKLAQFIVYDSVTQVGERLPIWGGPDSATEHVFNRLGDLLSRDRSGLSFPDAEPG